MFEDSPILEQILNQLAQIEILELESNGDGTFTMRSPKHKEEEND